MNKICTNPKNYRLTLNKVYKIIEVDDDESSFTEEISSGQLDLLNNVGAKP